MVAVSEIAGESTYDIHLVRGDATNSAAAQRSKVHVCSCRSTYCAGIDAGTDDREVDSTNPTLWDRTRDCYADLQFVIQGTANEQFDMYNRQLAGMGAPQFKAKSYDAGPPKPGCGNLRVLCHVTDDGPDQKGCQKLIQQELSSDPTTLYCRFRCCLHQVHICVSKQLKKLKSFLAANSQSVHVSFWKKSWLEFEVVFSLYSAKRDICYFFLEWK